MPNVSARRVRWPPGPQVGQVHLVERLAGLAASEQVKRRDAPPSWASGCERRRELPISGEQAAARAVGAPDRARKRCRGPRDDDLALGDNHGVQLQLGDLG